MACPTKSTELLQEFDAFRYEIIRKLGLDLIALRRDIVREMDSQSSGNHRQTRPDMSEEQSETSLDNSLWEKLSRFTKRFTKDLDEEINRRFLILAPHHNSLVSIAV